MAFAIGSFLLTVFAWRVLDVADFVSYTFIFLWSMFFSGIAHAFLTAPIQTNIGYLSGNIGDTAILNELNGALLFVATAISLAYSVVFALFFPHDLYGIFMLVLFIYVFSSIFYQHARRLLFLQVRAKSAAMIDIGRVSVLLAAMVAGYFVKFEVTLLALLFFLGMTHMILSSFVISKNSPHLIAGVKSSWLAFREQGSLLSVYITAQWLSVIGHFYVGSHAMGLENVAGARLLQTLVNPLQILQQAMDHVLPSDARKDRNSHAFSSPLRWVIYRNALLGLIIIALTIAAVLPLSALYEVAFGQQAPSKMLIILFCFPIVFGILVGPAFSMLRVLNRISAVVLAAVCGLLVGLSVSFPLQKTFELVGFALASTIGSITTYFVSIIILLRRAR